MPWDAAAMTGSAWAPGNIFTRSWAGCASATNEQQTRSQMKFRHIGISSFVAARLSFRPRRSTMLQERIPDHSQCVEPDRVRREQYDEPGSLELATQRNHEHD